MLKNFTVIDILNTRSDSVVNIKGNNIRFNPPTAAELDYPQYVEFLVNTKDKQFAIRPCSANAEMAVPFCKGRERKKVYITQATIASVIRKMANWDMNCNFNMEGIYDSDENALAYSVESAVVPEPMKGGWQATKRRKEAAAKAAAENEVEE